MGSAGGLVLGLAGAAIGAPFGMAGLGFTIGSTLYGAFQKQDPIRQSQSLMDLKVPGTEYGQPITYLFGRMRIAPQLWYNTDRIPLYETQTSGGKGAAPPEQESTTITYSIDILYGFTDNVILGVARIWDSGKLIWRTDSEASSGTIAASSQAEHWSRLTIYTGASDQLPDPDYEAAVGVGNAPAYRTRGTGFTKALQLGQSGQLRNLTFEVVTEGTQGPVISHYEGLTSDNNTCALYSPDTGELWGDDPQFGSGIAADRIGVYNLASETWSYVTPESPWHELGTVNNGPRMIIAPELDAIYVQTRNPSAAFLNTQIFKLSDHSFVDDFTSVDEFEASEFAVIGVDTVNQTVLVYQGTFGGMKLYNVDGEGRPTTAIGGFATSGPGTHARAHADADGNYWLPYVGAQEFWKITPGGTRTIIPADADGFDNAGWTQAIDVARQCLYYWSQLAPSGEYLKKLDFATSTMSRVNSVAYSTSDPKPSHGNLIYSEDIDKVVSIIPTRAYQLDAVDGSIDATVTITGDVASVGFISAYPSVVWAPQEDGIVEVRWNVLTVDCLSVEETQSRICLRTGLTAGQIDVTELSSITRDVCCLPWTQVSPGRQPTELLMGCYFYETTMSGGKVKFVPRGGSTVATIPYEDLVWEGDEDPFPLRKNNDIELPAFKAVTYINLSNDYQNDTQQSDRLITATSTSVDTAEMAIGMTPSEAKAVADTHSLDQAASIAVATIKLLRADYPRLEPTDPILVTAHDGSTIRMRIVEMTDEFPFLTLRLVIDDTSVLTSQGITSVDYSSSTEVSSPATTLMQLLDIPILQDADDDAGFYVATKGSVTPYPGAAVFGSADGVDYIRQATVNESAIFGNCTTVLGDWTGPRVFDFVNTVRVNVGEGVVLTSSTRAAVLNSQAINAFAIGSDATGYELGQFIDATFVSDGVYDLSRLLRGSRGTEWRMTGHVAGEKFVLLRAQGIRRIVLTNAQLGVSRYYKGVTLGRTIGTATARTFTDNGVGKKPFSPVLARVSRDGSNNATITWETRSRLGVRMIGPLGVSVPADDAIEAWSIDFYTDDTYTTLADTKTSSTPSYTYTAADQTTAGLTPGNPLFMDIHKVSSIVGRGYPLRRAA